MSITETSNNPKSTLHRPHINPFTARVDDGGCEVVVTFTSVDKILWCNHSNEISLEVLSSGVICFKKFYKMKFGIFVEFCLWSYLAVKGLNLQKKGGGGEGGINRNMVLGNVNN